MAPKAAVSEKKPAAPAKKSVAKKSSAGRKKGSKKAVESYKIYIYKVGRPGCAYTACTRSALHLSSKLFVGENTSLTSFCPLAGLEAGSPRHWYLLKGHVNPELLHR